MDKDQGDRADERTPAQFFFEVGYGACWAEAFIRNDEKPPFELTDAAVERAWQIAPEAHDDHEEFDRHLALAAAAPTLLAAVTKLLAHIEALQNQMRQYVEPSGYTSFDRKRIAFESDREAKDSLFIGDTIYLLDGPEQREVQTFARAAIALANPSQNHG